jgi:hypothetical protein
MKQGNTRRSRLMLRIAGIVDAFLLCFLCSTVGQGGSASGPIALIVLSLAATVALAVYGSGQGVFTEMVIQHTWSRVCRNLGGSFEAEVFSLGNSVRAGLQARPGQYVGNQYKLIHPKLMQVRGTREAWTGVIKPNPSQRLEDYTLEAEVFALAYHAQYVTFERVAKGQIAIRVGNVLIPAAYDFQEQ